VLRNTEGVLEVIRQELLLTFNRHDQLPLSRGERAGVRGNAAPE